MNLRNEILYHFFGFCVAFDLLRHLFHIMHYSRIMPAAKQFADLWERMVRQGTHQLHRKLTRHRNIPAAAFAYDIIIGNIKLIAYDLYDVARR